MRKAFRKYLGLLLLAGAAAAGAQQINLETQVKGLLQPINGGTGVDTHASSGCPLVTSGVWTFSSENCGSGSTSYFPGSPTVTVSGTPAAGQVLTATNSSTAGWSTPSSGVTWPTSSDLVISNGTSSPAGLAPVNGDCVVGSGGAWTAGSCGSGGVTWPATGDLVVSNSSSSPAGVAPVNGDCAVGSGGAWTAGSCLGSLMNNLLINSPASSTFYCLADSLGLPLTSDFCPQIQNGMGITTLSAITIGSGTGADLSSCATPGNGNCTQAGTTAPTTFPLGITANSKSMLQIYGANDLSEMGSTPTTTQLSYFAGGMKARMLFLGVPDAQKIPANSTKYCSTTGTWTAAPSTLPGGFGTFPAGSLQTSSNGATITCTLQNATDAGFIVIKNTTSSASFTMTVTNPGSSGSPFTVTDPYTGSSTLNETAAYTSYWGAVTDFYAVGYPNGSSSQAAMSGGYTTVTLTSTSTNPLYVVGPYFIGPSAGNQDYPAVVLALETYYGCNDTCSTVDETGLHDDANVNVMRAAQIQVANELRNNGLNVSYFNPNATPTGYNSSDPAQTSRVSAIDVTGGGSGFTSQPTATVTGCSVNPTFPTLPISGGAVVTGGVNALTSGACLGGTPVVVISGGGGTGATATASVASDGTHPNYVGGTNYAAAAIPSFNSAATSADHFIPSAGTGGGCSNNCTFTGVTTFDSAALQALVIHSTSTSGSGVGLDATAEGGHLWIPFSAGSAVAAGKLILFDATAGSYMWAANVTAVGGPGQIEIPSWMESCWSSLSDVTTTACDTGFSRTAAHTIGVGNGAPGDVSGTLQAAAINNPNAALVISGGTSNTPLTLTSANTAGTILHLAGSATGVDDWGIISAGAAISSHSLVFFEETAGAFVWKLTASSTSGPGSIESPSWMENCWSSTADVTTTPCDTGFSRDAAGTADLGNGTQGDKSGTLNAASGNFSNILTIGNHLNQVSTGEYAGSCAVDGSNTCTLTIANAYTSTPLCFVTVEGVTTGVAYPACQVSGTTVTVTTTGSPAATFGILLIGNPN